VLSATASVGLRGAERPSNTLTPAEKAGGWKLLFDGRTMRGWVDPREKDPPGDAWSIERGCLKANAHPKITEDLFSARKYRDFEWAFEWKISPGGNSGAKYRIQDHIWVQPSQAGTPRERFEAAVERSYVHRSDTRPDHGQDYVVGFEYQITDDSANGDALGNKKHTAGALYDMIAPSQDMTKPVGEFNQSRIVVSGNHVEHWLNGVKVVDGSLDAAAALEGIERRWGTAAPHVYELLAKQPNKDCPISLQNHGNDAWFRNLRIRELVDR
jgi:hypothetical protein